MEKECVNGELVKQTLEISDIVKNIKDGFSLNKNEKVVQAIIKNLNKNNGYCPCVNDSLDTKCPCTNYREFDKCCCNLYVLKHE